MLLSPKNNDLITPLALSEKLGHDAITSLLREKIDSMSATRLIVAKRDYDLDQVKLLIWKGIDVNGFAADVYGVRARLHRASGYHENLAIAKFLVEHGANVNIRQTTRCRTLLFEAAFWGHSNIAIAL